MNITTQDGCVYNKMGVAKLCDLLQPKSCTTKPTTGHRVCPDSM